MVQLHHDDDRLRSGAGYYFGRDNRTIPPAVDKTVRGVIFGPEADELEAKAHQFTVIQRMWLRDLLRYLTARHQQGPIPAQLRSQERIVHFARDVCGGQLVESHGNIGSYVIVIEANTRARLCQEEQRIANTIYCYGAKIRRRAKYVRKPQASQPAMNNDVASGGNAVNTPRSSGRIDSAAPKKPAMTTLRRSGPTRKT